MAIDDGIDKNPLDFENGFRFYEKAIEARNFQYKNYNTWANYYAIFTGALFIGYYSIPSCPSKCQLLSLVVVLVGMFTAICWHLTVKGHYHWMLSYIKILHVYEKELASILKNCGMKDWRVYSVFIKPKKDCSHANISSQKMTACFTLVISIAWGVLSAMELNKLILKKWYSLRYTPCMDYVCSFAISAVIVAVVYMIFRKIMNRPSHIDMGNDMTDMLYTNWSEKRWDSL